MSGRVWSRVVALGLVLPLAWWPIASVNAQPPSKKRKDLMDQLGLPKPKVDPAKPEADPPDPRAPDGDSEPDGPEPGTEPDSKPGSEPGPGTSTTPAASKPRITYRGRIRGLFDSGCKSCHATGASAGGTRFTISGDLRADYTSARRLLDTRKPATSVLLTKAAGQGHGGGANYPVGSANYKTVLDWIEGGALEGAPAKSTAAPAPAPAPVPGPAPGPKQAEPGKSPAPKPAVAKAPGDEPAPTEPEPSWVEPLAAPVGPAPLAYAPSVHAILQARCSSCHAESAFAGGGEFGLSGDPTTDYATAVALVDRQDPSASPLLAKARGEAHGGGRSLDVAEADYRELLAWIEGGALATAPPPPEYADGSDPGPDAVDATSGASKMAVKPGGRLGDGTPVPETGPSRLPFSLPFHLRLNGRFDLSYERRDYKNHPFGPGRNALATYHHFLFLSRSGAKDPFGFNVEVMTQQFFEFNARFKTKNDRAKFLIKAGKILVPFGDEPLYHTSYGGKTGFDQELLPVIWSRPGVSFNAHVQAGPVSITNDTYAVQGYALRAPDGVLNLQGDFAGVENFQFGVGNRVGLSWAPLTAWYSTQVNPLGHDRLLFMQALDVEFWRLKDVPFLEDLVVGFGAMRADVSGGGEHGGPGRDYYHFGSYGQVRYHPVDWLYMQYRWGLLTFDNRRNLYFDDTRMDERDSSSHNFSVGGIWKGFYAVVQLFWNLEKANEQDNDFLRFTVGYAF